VPDMPQISYKKAQESRDKPDIQNNTVFKQIADFSGNLAKVLASVVVLAPPFIKAAQWLLMVILPAKARNYKFVVIYALASLVAVVGISIGRRRIWHIFKRLLPPVTNSINRLLEVTKRLPKGIRIVVHCSAYLLLLAPIFFFVGKRTDLWHIAQSKWGGPQIDLISTIPANTFQPTINIPWFNYGQDFGQVPEWDWKGISKDPGLANEAFEKLAQSGVKCVLWFLLFDGRGSPEFDSQGYVTGLNSDFWKDYDAAIDLARKYKLGIVWVLVDHQLMFPPKREREASLFGRADMIENPGKREAFFKNALVPILSRYRYESQIAGWILVNEPENALKDGLVSFEALQEFIRHAATLVRKHTYRQPVSVGHSDLESLLEYSGKYSGELDFLVFHHYKPHLPPPVSHIRSLAPEIGNKPIYVGEFDIATPPIPIKELTTWSQRLGFAGLWPWSLKDNTSLPRYREAKLLSELVNAAIQDNDFLRVKFEREGLSNANELAANTHQDLDWWKQHWLTAVIPEVNKDISKRRSEIVLHEKEYEVNQDWEKRTNSVLTDLDSQTQQANNKLAENQKFLEESMTRADQLKNLIAGCENRLNQANAKLADLRRIGQVSQETEEWALRERKCINETKPNLGMEERNIQNARRGIEDSKSWMTRVSQERTAQEGHLKESKRMALLHRSLTDWNRYSAKWASELYLKYWESQGK